LYPIAYWISFVVVVTVIVAPAGRSAIVASTCRMIGGGAASISGIITPTIISAATASVIAIAVTHLMSAGTAAAAADNTTALMCSNVFIIAPATEAATQKQKSTE
jgi:hypothetical protein